MIAISNLSVRLLQSTTSNLLLIACVAAVAAGAAPPACAAPETWRFEPIHSQLWFSVDHQDFSHPLGRLRIKDGWFQFDDADWSAARVDVQIDLKSLDLGDPTWNATVASAQFLDTARWPGAHFVSRSVDRIDTNRGVIHGQLTLHGKTKPVDVAFTRNHIGTDPYAFKRKAGFSATATLHRSDFGMTRYADVVGEDIRVRIEIEGVRSDDAPPPAAAAER